jgi:hypothetical protein
MKRGAALALLLLLAVAVPSGFRHSRDRWREAHAAQPAAARSLLEDALLQDARGAAPAGRARGRIWSWHWPVDLSVKPSARRLLRWGGRRDWLRG